MALTPKQQRFVEEYLIDLNATQAAIRAGYSEKNADKIGSQLLGKTRVAASIREAQEKRTRRTEITADYVLTTIRETVEALLNDREKNAANIFKGSELLGKHIKLFTDKHEITGADSGPIQITVVPVKVPDAD
jgi:phage terminase small subunit